VVCSLLLLPVAIPVRACGDDARTACVPFLHTAPARVLLLRARCDAVRTGADACMARVGRAECRARMNDAVPLMPLAIFALDISGGRIPATAGCDASGRFAHTEHATTGVSPLTACTLLRACCSFCCLPPPPAPARLPSFYYHYPPRAPTANLPTAKARRFSGSYVALHTIALSHALLPAWHCGRICATRHHSWLDV